jgi:hypothetical protein
MGGGVHEFSRISPWGFFIKLLNDALSNSNEMEDGNQVGINKLDEKYFRV